MKQFIIAICCVAMSACTGGNTTDTKTSLGPAEFDEQSKTTAEAILLDVRTAVRDDALDLTATCRS